MSSRHINICLVYQAPCLHLNDPIPNCTCMNAKVYAGKEGSRKAYCCSKIVLWLSKDGSNMVNNDHRGIVLYTLYFIVVDMELFKIILTFVINIMKTYDEH